MGALPHGHDDLKIPQPVRDSFFTTEPFVKGVDGHFRAQVFPISQTEGYALIIVKDGYPRHHSKPHTWSGLPGTLRASSGIPKDEIMLQTQGGKMTTAAILPDVGLRATRRIARRLLPFLFVLYVIAFLDRVNVGYAGLEMSRDLGFSDKIFGFGAGIFSIGYFLFEIPGALIVERWSARRWIARILITWGIVTILMATVHTPRQFYLARFLLGVAEAGFFPGIVVYLTHWFRYEDRAKAGAIFMAAIPMSSILGSPLAGWILGQH